ncbi:MAG: c-type cytochrome [Saprospiraceae bacterium]|nr:c-type cytochrome [Saprospiraceae bacterium]
MKNRIYKYLLAFAPAFLLAASVTAEAVEKQADPYFYDRLFSNMLFATAGVVIIGAILALFYLLNIMVKVQQIRIYEEQGLDAYLSKVKEQKESWWKRAYKRWTDVVPLEKEKDILMDHDYDGIRELDNSLPPWWVAMFYITIAYAVVYIGIQHFSDYGMSQEEEYQAEMEQAEESIKAYLAKQANLVDETNAELLDDDASLAAGKVVFDEKCAACHGMAGEGGVGPNLTDPYWLHGGSVKDIFKTVKYGVPEKGMISWKSQLRPAEIHKVSSYIFKLGGTNPPNQKEPQGELYQVDNSAPADTTAQAEKLSMN